MMLIHKQPSPFLSNPALTHRRHPSAPPTVIVQPTRTPGLLSLSKPPRRPQRSNNRSPRPRQQQNILLNAAEIKPAVVRPKKQLKSDKPHSTPSQAEASDSSSDPFSPSFKPSPKSQVPLVTPAPSKAIPVPALPRPSKRQLSRSEPAVGHNWDYMCDDSNDESTKAPSTPTRPRAASTLETPRRKYRHHKRTPSDHIFAMSSDDEAVSGPDDLRALLDFVRRGSPASISTPPPARKAPKPEFLRSLSPASREKYFELEAQNEVAGYFASSSFQNSPSPDDLPAPLFV